MGLALYFFLGAKLYQLVMVYGRGKIEGFIGDGSGASFVYWALFILFMATLFFVVNWTFVMVVSVLPAPFNDAISARVERSTRHCPERRRAFP